ncbi:MAG: hypothetical protein EU539_02335 [Promethearchaeota archaeon]|nr:MAG: hypothetical protein EU539_02335 [Candidatus Lokiarchaeota archaeon]
MENRLLNQFDSTISTQWPSQEIVVSYEPLNNKELFELAYHTCNSVNMRNIYIKLSLDENKGGSRAILYSNTKKFVHIESLDDNLIITKFFPEDNKDDKLATEIKANLETRKLVLSTKEKDLKNQILKSILVERKLDECANLVMLKDISRKIYFAIGDARESAAVVPIFMQAEGASLVQLALNKWMSMTQNLDQEKPFPENLVPGLLKNLMQIKKWLLNLISTHLEK